MGLGCLRIRETRERKKGVQPKGREWVSGGIECGNQIEEEGKLRIRGTNK